MTAAPLVYILLLNYRGAAYTLACLDSLRQLDYPNYRIIVIDNDSPDDSVAVLKARLESHPGSFRLIESAANLGFSGGNNLGIQAALTEAGTQANAYVWLLNNDTTASPDSLTHLMNEALKTGGIAGSLLLYPDGSYQQVGNRFNWWLGSNRGYAERSVHNGMPVETLIGASMLIPFAAFQQAGLLDESFFLYFEDGEASLRYARQGFPLTVSTHSKIYHEESATTGKKSRLTQYYYHRNRLRLLFMFASFPQKVTISLYASFRLLRSVLKGYLKTDPDHRVASQIHMLAWMDFWKRRHGKCQHPLEQLR